MYLLSVFYKSVMQNRRAFVVCFDSQVIYINALCGQNVEVLSTDYLVHKSHTQNISKYTAIYICTHTHTHLLKSRI